MKTEEIPELISDVEDDVVFLMRKRVDWKGGCICRGCDYRSCRMRNGERRRCLLDGAASVYRRVYF